MPNEGQTFKCVKINTMSLSRLKADGIEVAESQLDQIEADPLVTDVEVKTEAEPQTAEDGTSQLAVMSSTQG